MLLRKEVIDFGIVLALERTPIRLRERYDVSSYFFRVAQLGERNVKKRKKRKQVR